MKYIKVLIFAIGLTFLGCNQNEEVVVIDEEQTENLQEKKMSKDEEEIQNLIRQVLKWADSKWADSEPSMLSDDQDSIYIGFNLNVHEKDVDKLRKTGFFAKEFIENYDKIILTLDKKLRNNEYGEWLVGDLPPFNFASDYSPWCNCQDNLSPWDDVEIEVIELNNDKAQLVWKWGESDYSNENDSYKFRTVKENGKWKISYMEGFDFKKSVE